MSKGIDILKKASLRKTPFRMKVLDLFLATPHAAILNATLETRLGEHDRITLYRTLRSFEQKGILHKVVDGSNDPKYALCHQDCTVHLHTKEHAHFLCNDCGTTYCLDSIGDVAISLPEKYKLGKIQVSISGICATCN